MTEPVQRQTVPPACPACGGGLRETSVIWAPADGRYLVRCLSCDIEWMVGPIAWVEVSGPGKRGSTTRRWLRRERAREAHAFSIQLRAFPLVPMTVGALLMLREAAKKADINEPIIVHPGAFILERTDLPPMPDPYMRRPFTIAPHHDDASGDETVYATGWSRR